MDNLKNEKSNIQIDKKVSELLIELGELIKKADQIFIWRNYYHKGLLYKEQVYEWNKNIKTTDCSKITHKLEEVLIPPELEDSFLKDISVHGLVKDMTDLYSKSLLEENNVKSTLILATFVHEKLWGSISLDNCSAEENWSNDEIDIVKKYNKMLADILLW